MKAYDTVQIPKRRLTRFKPEIVALVFEHRPWRCAFIFGMDVISLAELPLDAFNHTVQITQFTLQTQPVRLHFDRYVVFSHRAVVVSIGAYRRAQIAMLKKHRSAHRTAVALTGRVADAVCKACRARFGTRQTHGHIDIACCAAKAIHMQGVTVVACFQQHGATFFPIAGCQIQIDLAREAAFFIKQGFARNAVVNHVDDATHSTSAVEKRAWAAQNFNALNADGVGRDGMVIA